VGINAMGIFKTAMLKLGTFSTKAQRLPAGGQEESKSLNEQTPPTIGVTRRGAFTSDRQNSELCHYSLHAGMRTSWS